MQDDPTWELLDAYLAGTATPAQEDVVRRWLAEVPGRQAALESLRSDASGDRARWNVDAAWARVAATMGEHDAATRSIIPLRARAPRYQRAWRIAALLLVTIGVGVVGREVLRTRVTDSRLASAAQAVATRPGQRLVVNLPDGSRVTLNAGSQLRYDFGPDGARDVALDGEAYFEVRHDERRPFRVHAHGGVAEDVGTRFVVRAYAEQPAISVAVAEGAVRVGRASDSAEGKLVNAGMLGIIPARGPVSVSPLPASDRYFAWTRGVLALDGQPFSDLVPMLEHWYGVSIRVPDSALGAKRVFGTFEHETLQDALAALALALDARYTQAGQSITFTPRAR